MFNLMLRGIIAGNMYRLLTTGRSFLTEPKYTDTHTKGCNPPGNLQPMVKVGRRVILTANQEKTLSATVFNLYS
jgi:hypothetical protein